MITNEQLIYIIRAIHPEISVADHGKKYWVLSMMDGSTQLSTSEIYKWDFENIAQPTENEINNKWIFLGQTLPVIIPTSCTRKQGNLALLQMGHLDQIESLVATAPRNIRIAFDDATTYERADANLIYLANAAGMSSADLDALFTLAVTL